LRKAKRPSLLHCGVCRLHGQGRASRIRSGRSSFGNCAEPQPIRSAKRNRSAAARHEWKSGGGRCGHAIPGFVRMGSSCPLMDACAASELVASQASTATSAIDRTVIFAPASLPGVPTNLVGLAATGSTSTVRGPPRNRRKRNWVEAAFAKSGRN
jgi:hypothetical protein